MSHPRHQSIFYKITSPKMLADRLRISEQDLYFIILSKSNYRVWRDKKSGRLIQEPRKLLSKIHRRVAYLLSKIDTPDYLHSAKKGKSYISNAMSHSVDEGCVKIDIAKFYASVRIQAVFHFFKDRMKCAPDVAGIMSRLLTIDGYLPTGSSSSPIISYFTYEDLFEELAALANSRGCKMTVYVDDIVFTGGRATSIILYEARKIIGSYHLRGHKTKVFRPKQPRVITGVAITRAGGRLPNRRQALIATDLSLFERLPPGRDKLNVARRLAGRLYEASQIDPTWRLQAEKIAGQRNTLHRMYGK